MHWHLWSHGVGTRGVVLLPGRQADDTEYATCEDAAEAGERRSMEQRICGTVYIPKFCEEEHEEVP